jgi:hypothetical protein
MKLFHFDLIAICSDIGDADTDLVTVCRPALSLCVEQDGMDIEEIEPEWTRLKADVYRCVQQSLHFYLYQ